MKKIIWGVILIGLIFFIGKGWWNSQFDAVSSDKTEIAFVVDKGAGISQIADDLKKANLIRSTFFFKLYTKQQDLDAKIQPGTFKLTPAMSVATIATTLTNQPLDNWVTLLEGWRVEEMADKLNQVLGTDKKAFIAASKEGYMFPDTYLFPKEYSVKQIADRMRANFDVKYSDGLKAKVRALGLTESQGVILASLVEREARSDEVRTKVAGIILKRFKMGMKLDIDATVQYAKDTQTLKSGKKPDKFWLPITRENYTDIISSYNTYINNGFPPTPIANPSLSSLEAAANADPSTPYLYYYHDSQGNSYYAKTLEEHNQNVANHP
ncbi:MAG: endolytic transglycosylase MltG [Candidatus Daviesbacteria bacterium]|nr:endolytic transglycosylase MltG [Candidatus Daviesbacteria bacterium]